MQHPVLMSCGQNPRCPLLLGMLDCATNVPCIPKTLKPAVHLGTLAKCHKLPQLNLAFHYEQEPTRLVLGQYQCFRFPRTKHCWLRRRDIQRSPKQRNGESDSCLLTWLSLRCNLLLERSRNNMLAACS